MHIASGLARRRGSIARPFGPGEDQKELLCNMDTTLHIAFLEKRTLPLGVQGEKSANKAKREELEEC